MKTKDPAPRQVVVKKDFIVQNPTKKGYFHKWCETFLYDSGVCFVKTLGLVEFEDGSVRMVEPELIKFEKN
ncbi:hypothetical protein SanaruYs_05530 [Chryseotalea sanaruensis]|uniref:Uncharacterized protein n=1 Tax=Chryseotalea sanaruensis TaxID=2482724 RepID=A0A401U5Y6_9BACT|nr:hypothetical protein [Chryseotalea sanaruensis]GCC50338.1 hypothetical protein SanaruYs_05530 [Chryseotalea sanaruensis]